MDKSIKTRDVVKDIKVLDKKAVMASSIREAHAKTKSVAERTESSQQADSHGVGYALDKTEQSARSGIDAVRQATVKGADKATDAVRNMHSAAKEAKQGAQAAQSVPKQTVHRAASRTAAISKQAAASSTSATKSTIKQGAKGTVKTTSKGIKTAGATAKTTVKTSQQAAQSAKAAAKGTQIAARNAAQAARVSAKAIATAAKAAAKGIAAFAKMAIAAAKSLVAAIAAGGWVAVAVILVICLVGLVVSSAFGIFFAGGDLGDGNPSLRQVVAEVNREHLDEIERIKSSNSYDEVAINGSRTPWKDVLAIYAVKTATDPNEPYDVTTLDPKRQELLRQVFWDMNSIDSRIQEREVAELVLRYDKDGNPHASKASTGSHAPLVDYYRTFRALLQS